MYIFSLCVVLCISYCYTHIFPLQTNLKQFMQYVRDGAIRKVEKILTKGLDPNFNESDKIGY